MSVVLLSNYSSQLLKAVYRRDKVTNGLLTFYSLSPHFHESEVNEADNNKYQQHENVTNDFGRANWKSTGHLFFSLSLYAGFC